MREKQLPKVSAILPTSNGKKVIAKLLRSLAKQQYPGGIEVIAVDNGSTDGTPQLISQKFPQVKLIKLKSNLGSAPAFNMAARKAEGKYILATNDDVVFEKNCLAQLVSLAESDEKIGIVTGKMLNPQKKLAIPGFRINHYLGYHPYDLKNTHKIRECDWAVGACLLIKKKLLEEVGFFDPDYIFCGEEYDLSFQIRRLGLKVMYTPKAIFYHYFQRSHNPNREVLFAHYRGKIRYMLKNGRIDHLLVFLPAQLLVVPIWCLLRGKIINILATYKALIWNLAHLPNTLVARKKRPWSINLENLNLAR